jgi:hypothetical protein
MFRILCDPSSGITELCLTEISRSDFLTCVWSVFGSVILNLWCVCVCVCVCVYVCVLCENINEIKITSHSFGACCYIRCKNKSKIFDIILRPFSL